ncbi:MAG: hypothetical protein HZB41_00410 [Ignavibacteriae bacterium]|nr:hypothetical protein [Ignavibacteriota bacterium]
MKKSLIAIFFSLIIISLFAISSCSDTGSNAPTKVSVNNEFSDMTIHTYHNITGDEVNGGNIEKEFSIINPYNSKSNDKSSKIQCDDGDGHHDDGDDDHEGEDEDDEDGCHYGEIFYQLNLTDAQRFQVHEFKEAFEDCVESAEEIYENAKETIILNANQQRNDIKQQLENGTIDQAQAYALLQNLKAETMQLIADQKAVFKAAAADCLCNFLKNIISVMDDFQKETFITWVETNSCIEINCDLRGTAGGQQ